MNIMILKQDTYATPAHIKCVDIFKAFKSWDSTLQLREEKLGYYAAKGLHERIWDLWSLWYPTSRLTVKQSSVFQPSIEGTANPNWRLMRYNTSATAKGNQGFRSGGRCHHRHLYWVPSPREVRWVQEKLTWWSWKTRPQSGRVQVSDYQDYVKSPLKVYKKKWMQHYRQSLVGLSGKLLINSTAAGITKMFGFETNSSKEQHPPWRRRLELV